MTFPTASAVRCGELDVVDDVNAARSVLKVSSPNLLKFPFLGDMRAVLVRSGHSLLHILEHKRSLKRFQISIDAQNLNTLGFLKRDTLDDCFDILKGAYEKGDATGVRPTLSILLTLDGGVMHAPLDGCDAIEVKVTEDALRRKPFEYVLLLTQSPTEDCRENDRYKVAALKKELALWKLRTTVTLSSTQCWAEAGAFCGMRQLKRIWKRGEGDSAQLFALREHSCNLLIRAPGVYKFHPLEDNMFVNARRVTRRYEDHRDTDASAAAISQSSYVVRLQVGDEVFITSFCAQWIANQCLYVTKL